MLTLTLTQSADGINRNNINLRLLDDNQLLKTAVTQLNLNISSRDLEEMRWYLEDFLQHTLDPAPLIAKRIEQRMAEIGVELFTAIFETTNDTRHIWAILSSQLDSSRIEIVTDKATTPTIPWEL